MADKMGPGKAGRVLRYAAFLRDWRKFQSLAKKTRPRLLASWRDLYPCLSDNTPTTDFDRHYVYHTAWAARVLARMRPEYHTDISSFLYFSTIVSAFLPVRFFDLRPAKIYLENLTTNTADLLHLPFTDESIPSLSCMHVVEHAGLGRYGDSLDPDADLKAISELKRVLSPGGTLLFVVPIGTPRILFNAHRVYSFEQISDYFSGLSLSEFSLIADDVRDGDGILDTHGKLKLEQHQGCGCFIFRK